MSKKILDACCGGRMFWFDKQHPDAVFIDIREPEIYYTKSGKNKDVERKIIPDVVMDFRKMDFQDNTFSLVVFDPPHLKTVGKNSRTAKMYGKLDKYSWEEDLSLGFKECFRVLKPDGVLIFKWNEYEIPLKKVLNLTHNKPLFGHKSGKQQKTHWVTFMKTVPSKGDSHE